MEHTLTPVAVLLMSRNLRNHKYLDEEHNSSKMTKNVSLVNYPQVTMRLVGYNRPLSLGGHVESRGNKKLCFARQASARREFSAVRGLSCKNKAFYSPETQHGRRVIKVYHLISSNLEWNNFFFLPKTTKKYC